MRRACATSELAAAAAAAYIMHCLLFVSTREGLCIVSCLLFAASCGAITWPVLLLQAQLHRRLGVCLQAPAAEPRGASVCAHRMVCMRVLDIWKDAAAEGRGAPAPVAPATGRGATSRRSRSRVSRPLWCIFFTVSRSTKVRR